MRKPLPLNKIIDKLDRLYDFREVLEREDATQPALWGLEDRILSLEYFLEELHTL